MVKFLFEDLDSSDSNKIGAFTLAGWEDLMTDFITSAAQKPDLRKLSPPRPTYDFLIQHRFLIKPVSYSTPRYLAIVC